MAETTHLETTYLIDDIKAGIDELNTTIGQVLTRQDGTLKVGGFAGCKDGVATKSESGYRVLKIINENIALLLVK